MRKLTKTAITVAAMAAMTFGTVASISADENKSGWVGSGTNYEYYNGKGEKVTNQWVQAGDDWYFLDGDGKMATNAFIRKDTYTNEKQVLNKEEVNDLWTSDDFDDDSKFYFVDASGKMVTGWVEIDRSSIYLSPNSSKKGKIWYYFNPSTDTAIKGQMYTNAWIKAGEDWYAVGENGQMYTNAKLPSDLERETSYYDVEEPSNEGMDVYYVDSNGKMIRGWYKTVDADTDASLPAYRGWNALDVFTDKDKYIYADPSTGVLAWNEWVNDGSTWYYIGTGVHEDGHSDDKLDVSVYKNELLERSFYPNIAEELNEMTPYVVGNLDEKFVMLDNKIIKWTNHNANSTEYFYLKKNGAMLQNSWYQYDDDYYLWANSKGELAYDKVATVGQKYYYFNRNGICDYKVINSEADYAVKLPTGRFVFYNTDGKVWSENYHDDYENVKISDMRAYLNDVQESKNENERFYVFGTRKATIKSMTDLQVVLAYAAETQNLLNSGEFEIYKLRNSTTMKSTVKGEASKLAPGSVELSIGGAIGLKIKGAGRAATSSAVTVADEVWSNEGKLVEVLLKANEDSIVKESVAFENSKVYNASINATDILDQAISKVNSQYGMTLTRGDVDYTLGGVVTFSITQQEDVTTQVIVAKIPSGGEVLVDNSRVVKGAIVADNSTVYLQGKGTYEFTINSAKDGVNADAKTIRVTVE